MNKIVKRITLSIVILVAIAALSMVALVTLVDPNSYKSLIIKTVFDNTGRKLSLDGAITWKLWPNIGLHIEQVSLSNPANFSTPNLMSLKSADVSVQLIPLLHNSIIIDAITVDGLNLDLIKNGAINNWTFSTDSSTVVSTSNNESTPSGAMNLSLSKFDITNATVTYNDLKGVSHYNIENFNFKIDATHDGIIQLNSDKEIIDIKNAKFNFSDALKGEINFNLNGFTTPKYNGDINLEVVSLGKLLNNFIKNLKYI